jgi:hypothetical protein
MDMDMEMDTFNEQVKKALSALSLNTYRKLHIKRGAIFKFKRKRLYVKLT